MRRYLSVLVLLIGIVNITGTGCYSNNLKQDPVLDQSWQEESDGRLSWPHYMLNGKIRFTLIADTLSTELLSLIKQGIEYALDEGAAREISKYDFYHGHFLFKADKDRKQRTVQTVDGILFHTQERVFYSQETFSKRNIFIGFNGVLEIVPCKFKWLANGEPFCKSRTPKNLSMVSGLSGIYFVIVDDIPEEKLKKYRHNIIVVREHKVLVGQPDFL